MATKLPGIVHPSDAFTEDVLKCIKNALKQKSGEFTNGYDGSKAFTRNDVSYITEITDDAKSWRERFNRRVKNLQYGFFADKGKPYQTLGKVYLEPGELILQSITDDLKSKLTKIPGKPDAGRGKATKSKKGTPLEKRESHNRMITKLDPTEATAGFTAIKRRLSEVQLMKKGVFATQSLCGYLGRTEQEKVGVPIKKDFMEMNAPHKNQWKVLRAVNKVTGVVIPKDSSIPVRKKAVKSKFPNTGMGSELDELEDEEELLRWREEKGIEYLQDKLQALNTILCCLYNIKSKLLKQQTPLPNRTVSELLRQDIALDQYGKPMSCRGTLVTDDASVYSDGINSPDGGERKPGFATSNMTNVFERKRISSVQFSTTPRRPRLNNLYGKPGGKNMRVETWEDLLVAGDRNKKLNGQKSAGPGGKYSKGGSTSRRSGATANTAENQQPWCNIAQAEKAINEKRKMTLLGSISRRTAKDVLNDIQHEFVKLQKKLAKGVEEDFVKRKGEQLKFLQSKFATINFGPVSSVALEKMRSDARVLTRDLKDARVQPMSWFIDLKEEVRCETGLEDEIMNSILTRVARFQYEDGKTIPFAKEKLCLLIMSMPAHLLMNASMIHAILFILAKVFESPPELLDVWLSARKLSTVKRVETSATPKAPHYV